MNRLGRAASRAGCQHDQTCAPDRDRAARLHGKTSTRSPVRCWSPWQVFLRILRAGYVVGSGASLYHRRRAAHAHARHRRRI